MSLVFLQNISQAQKLWQDNWGFFVTSYSDNDICGLVNHPECLAFLSNEKGEITSWVEITGIYEGPEWHADCAEKAHKLRMRS